MKYNYLLFWFIAFLYQSANAAYSPSELFKINWGEGQDEFVAEASIDDLDPGTPDDSTDDYFLTGGGPHEVFVDVHRNIVFVSQYMQFKGFSDSGQLLFDFSAESPDYVQGMFRGDIDKIYLDNSMHIYIVTTWPSQYVPEINYATGTVDSLSPFAMSPDQPISDMNWSYDGRLMFFSDSLGWITYDGNKWTAGGTWAVKLADGRNYNARLINPDTVEINSSTNPDIWGHGSDMHLNRINLGVDNLTDVQLLKSMDPTHIYLLLWYFTDVGYYEVWQFDLQYNLVDKVVPPEVPEYYDSTPKPFITDDGDIYEFRCLDDGLHVIKWTKQ